MRRVVATDDRSSQWLQARPTMHTAMMMMHLFRVAVTLALFSVLLLVLTEVPALGQERPPLPVKTLLVEDAPWFSIPCETEVPSPVVAARRLSTNGLPSPSEDVRVEVEAAEAEALVIFVTDHDMLSHTVLAFRLQPGEDGWPVALARGGRLTDIDVRNRRQYSDLHGAITLAPENGPASG